MVTHIVIIYGTSISARILRAGGESQGRPLDWCRPAKNADVGEPARSCATLPSTGQVTVSSLTICH